MVPPSSAFTPSVPRSRQPSSRTPFWLPEGGETHDFLRDRRLLAAKCNYELSQGVSSLRARAPCSSRSALAPGHGESKRRFRRPTPAPKSSLTPPCPLQPPPQAVRWILDETDSRLGIHAFAVWAAGRSTGGAPWPFKPLRTDSVSLGLCISLFTLAIISLAISIRFFFSIRIPLYRNRLISSLDQGRRSASLQIILEAARANVCSHWTAANEPEAALLVILEC
jgi:hypothetical protein